LEKIVALLEEENLQVEVDSRGIESISEEEN